MRTFTSSGIISSTENVRTNRQSINLPERSFEPILSDIARLLWPAKTAAHLAAVVGCSERAAEFYLAGQRAWSGDAIAAIVAEILQRHKMRNVKVVKRG